MMPADSSNQTKKDTTRLTMRIGGLILIVWPIIALLLYWSKSGLEFGVGTLVFTFLISIVMYTGVVLLAIISIITGIFLVVRASKVPGSVVTK